MTDTHDSNAGRRLEQLLQQRILVLDGAMGTMVQTLQLDEATVRGRRFADHPQTLKNFIDILCLTHPETITDIHRQYLAAGADIVETNTFGATRIAMEDFQLESLARELNLAAAACARKAVDEFNARTPDKPRFVAGSIGPTSKTASISPDVEDPGFRATSFDQMVESYYEQVAALVEGGVDILFPETAFDTLNLKACLFAIDKFFERAPGPAAGHGLGDDPGRQRPHAVGPDRRRDVEFDLAFPAAERRDQLCPGSGADAAVRGRAVGNRPGLPQLPSQRRLAERVRRLRRDAGADGRRAAASSWPPAG